MKKTVLKIAMIIGFLSPIAAQATCSWTRIDREMAPAALQVMHPKNFMVYTLDEAPLKMQLNTLPNDPDNGQAISLPMPDGSFRDFIVWQTPMMPDVLANKYPEIKTYTARAVNDARVTAKLDFTVYGFHAMVFDGENTSFIDPYDNYHDGYYMVHYKSEETRPINQRMKCLVHTNNEISPANESSMDILQKGLPKLHFKTVNGYQLRTYKLALSADNFYCQAATGLASPTIAQAFSKMTTTMNRVNGVYEREVSVHMVFVANEDTLIWTRATGTINGTDPFNTIDANAPACCDQNQIVCDARIGDANYDIGHVFTTGAGGLSDLGVICAAGFKASSVTGSTTPVGDGFDIDYVAHEMGHEHGGDHPFNNGTDNSCGGGNINAPTAYEPGSGSTIMGYAGICDPDDLQFHSDPYFHTVNLEQIQTYITTDGDVCAVKTATGNKLVKYAPFTASYSIPFLTPFELYAPVLTDSVVDSATLYCWEQWDLGDVGERFVNTHLAGPLFRSFNPTPSRLRIFPKLSMVLSGTLSDAGTEGAEGEKVPDVARDLHFLCTFRDIFHNYGCITVPDDRITLHAVNTTTGFTVTSQGTTGISYAGHSTQTVTWNVVSTNVAPISATNVDIYMSLDGGNSWYYHVGSFPNTGTATITVPNPAATTAAARFKVKGGNNVFFNVNSQNFTVTYNPSFPVTSGIADTKTPMSEVKLFPVPTSNILHVSMQGSMQAMVYNSIGQQTWKGTINNQTEISVASWPKGIYYMQIMDADNQRMVKKFVVE